MIFLDKHADGIRGLLNNISLLWNSSWNDNKRSLCITLQEFSNFRMPTEYQLCFVLCLVGSNEEMKRIGTTFG